MPPGSGWALSPRQARAPVSRLRLRSSPAVTALQGTAPAAAPPCLRDSRAKASAAARRRSSFRKSATRVVVSDCTSPVMAVYQSAPGDLAQRRLPVAQSGCEVALRAGEQTGSRVHAASNAPGATNVARTRSSCARTSSSGWRAATRPGLVRLCSIEVLIRAVHGRQHGPSIRGAIHGGCGAPARACRRSSCAGLSGACSWPGSMPVLSRYLPSAPSSAERACACRMPDAREFASACSWVERSNSPSAPRISADIAASRARPIDSRSSVICWVSRRCVPAPRCAAARGWRRRFRR